MSSRKLSPSQVARMLATKGTAVEVAAQFGISERTYYRHKRREDPPSFRLIQPCGTDAAYQRHLRQGEMPCDPCVFAHARKNREDSWRRKAEESLMGLGLPRLTARTYVNAVWPWVDRLSDLERRVVL